MKIASWILNIISLVALVVGIIFTVIWACVTKEVLCKIGGVDFAYIDFAIVCYIAFIAFGFTAHMLAGKVIEEGVKFVYYSSFPAFALPFVVIFIVKGIIKLIRFIFKGISGDTSNNSAGKKLYIVIDERGCERELSFYESREDTYPDSPYYTSYYNRFRDDLGNFWRSYDNNETFVKETYEQTSRGY